MKRVLKIAGIAGVAGAIGLATPAFANCVLEGPYSVVSCAGIGSGAPTYFAPEPQGTLPDDIDPTWWQLGFGNENVDDPAGGAGDTSGGAWYVNSVVGPTGDLFIGNDKGAGNAALPGGLDLRDAAPFGGPAGSTCFGAAANWGAAGIDGCCDNNRNYYGAGATGDVSDQYLNPYYQAPPNPYAYSEFKDSPMGFLLREPTNTNFAAAFVRNRPRGGVPTPPDTSRGSWDMNLIINGDANPTQGGAPNIVPWQPIPQPDLSAAFQNPGDPLNSPRILSFDWTSIRLVHDGSSVPASDQVPGLAMGYDNYGAPITGAGVLDQPQLATYFIQEKPVDGAGNCDALAPWVNLAGPIAHPGDLLPLQSAGHIVNPDTCVRLCTHLGRVPAKAWMQPAGKADRGPFQIESQRGLYGDVGYNVCSQEKKVGGPLVSQRANLIALDRSQSVINVRFETTVELDITSIDVVGFDNKGASRVLMTVDPKQGNTGIGATYEVSVPRNIFRDTKQVQIVLQPTGEGSNLLEVR